MHQFRVDLTRFLGTTYFGEWLGITVSLGVLAFLYRRTFRVQLQSGASPSPAVLAIVAIFLAIVSLRATPTGDEPHYLVMIQSFLSDGDFDLRNNYEQKDYFDYYPVEIPDPHVITVGDRWYPVHGIGLPFLAAPFFALGGRPGVVIMLTVMTATGLRILWSLLSRMEFTPLATASAVVVAGFTLPLLSMSGQIFPEVPTFLLVALALRAIVAPALTGGDLAVFILSVGLLPWLHSKHTALATALLLTAALCHYQRGSVWVFTAGLGTLLISISCLGTLSYNWYGIWLPGPSIMIPPSPSGENSLAVIAAAANLFVQPWVGLTGTLLDQQSGLLLASPVYVLAIPGMVLLRRRGPSLTVACVIVFMSVYLPNGAFSIWYGGQASPARLLTPVVPVLAIGIASLLQFGKNRTWSLFTLLAIPSFLHAYLIFALPSFTRYGDPVSQHNFFVALLERYTNLDLTFLFPSFHEVTPATWLTSGFYLLFIAGICIFATRQHMAAPAANCS